MANQEFPEERKKKNKVGTNKDTRMQRKTREEPQVQIKLLGRDYLNPPNRNKSESKKVLPRPHHLIHGSNKGKAKSKTPTPPLKKSQAL